MIAQSTKLVLRGLPLPPSLNNAYATFQGRRILSKEGQVYKARVALLISQAASVQGFQAPAATPLRLTFRFWYARNNRDGSNTPKLLEDALSEALGFNDIWVWASAWTKAIDKQAPRCDVALEILTATE